MSNLISYNPANGEVVGEVAITSLESLSQVIADAKQAQAAWAQQSLAERSRIITRAYQGLEPSLELMAKLISQEMGKHFRRASYEAKGSIQNAAYLAAEVESALQSERLVGGSEIQYRPLGVVAVISPWNYPLAMANNLIIPALMAGNSVILKPSEETPLVVDHFVKALCEILPKGVLQVVHGRAEVGQALVEQDINMVAFTGSIATGKNIMENAASGLKRLVMELGGNDAMIVMHNADIQAAARFAVANSFENAGQMCISTERVYVHQAIAAEFEAQVVRVAQRYHFGPWDNPGVKIGPLVNKKQHQKAMAQLQDAQDKGAQFLLGDVSYQPPFIPATVISGMTPGMLLEQEETFAPVVAIARVKSMEEAVQRANDSVYGLGAVVFGGEGAAEVAEQLEVGMVSVNKGLGGSGESPWVGAKQSGFGFHGSANGHRQFAQVRVINF